MTCRHSPAPRITAGGASTPLASSITWKPFGPLAGLTYGNGLTLSRVHDGNYALSGIVLAGTGGALVDLGFTRDANGNVTAVTDQLGAARDAAYAYSDAGRLSAATGAWGADAYQWDANSNRTRADRTVGGSTFSDVATIAAASNQLTEVRDGAGLLAKSFAFTPGGDTASVTPASGPVQSLTYDARGRLAAVSMGGVMQASYAYDYSGQRVAKTQVLGTGVHYLFDGAGHLLAEHDAASGAPLREYVWLGDTVLAMVTGTSSPAYSFVTTGNLNEPLLVTNSAGAVISNTTRDPWGNVIVVAGGVALELGYPGQWADSAVGSGMLQNWMRDYDPALGRYAEADPIGLDGGSNLYAYALGNPIRYTDPTGEFVPLLVIGFLVGFDANLIYQRVFEGKDAWQPWSDDENCNPIDFDEALIAGTVTASLVPIGRAFKTSEFLFGRHNIGLFNRNNVLRIGRSWKGPARGGREVFRAAFGHRSWPKIPFLPRFPWHF